MRRKGIPASRLPMLRGIPLFAGCTDQELARISAHVDEVSFAPGERLVTEGTVGQDCFVLVSGEAEVSLGGRRLGTVATGGCIGEMAVLEHQPRSATVIARSPVRALAIEPRALSCVVGYSSVAWKLLRDLSSRLRAVEGAPVWARERSRSLDGAERLEASA